MRYFSSSLVVILLFACALWGEGWAQNIPVPNTHVPIQTSRVKGFLSLKGGRLASLSLQKYTLAPDPKSPHVELLSDQGLRPYYPQTGWISEQPGIDLPQEDTLWHTSDPILTPTQPVVLSWINPQGLKFQRAFHIDDQYVITVKETVINTLAQPLRLATYAYIRRAGPVETSGYFVLHEGLVGVMNDKLVESTYKDLVETPLQKHLQQPGWFGFTDKYWLTALIPHPSTPVECHSYGRQGSGLWYQMDFVTPYQTIAPQEAWSYETRLFAGPKILNLLDQYEITLGIPKFDLAIDFGWFYFLTKPLFNFLNYLQSIFGNFGYAILLLTIMIKGLFFPLANKSYRTMGRMKKLQPEIERLKTLYGDDRMKMNQELMDVYRQHKVNPMAGCLPMVVQIPVFFALYKVLFVTIEMRHAPFIGWIQDLSAPDPSNLFNLFGLIPWIPPSFLTLGAWPCVMGITMFLQQKMNPQPADPIQQKVMMFLPLIFTFTLASFPVGLVIYWAWSNILSITQQWFIGYLERQHTHKRR